MICARYTIFNQVYQNRYTFFTNSNTICIFMFITYFQSTFNTKSYQNFLQQITFYFRKRFCTQNSCLSTSIIIKITILNNSMTNRFYTYYFFNIKRNYFIIFLQIIISFIPYFMKMSKKFITLSTKKILFYFFIFIFCQTRIRIGNKI